MSILYNEDLRIAYERSDEIVKNVMYAPDRMIDTSRILEYVQREYCREIEVYTTNFERIQSESGSLQNCGAMTRIDFDSKPRAAYVVLNSNKPLPFQRFALMHQIGHLVTLPPDVQLNPDNFYVSAHISEDLTKISQKDLTGSYDLLREQIANIFALRVLMPTEQFYRVMRRLGDVQSAAAFFGLTEDAVISRMMIGA